MGDGVGEAKAKSGPPVRSIAVNRICGNQSQVWKTADSSIGRAPHWHCGGRGLESNSVHHDVPIWCNRAISYRLLTLRRQ